MQRPSLRRGARLDASGRSTTQGPWSSTDSGPGAQPSCVPSDRPARVTRIRPDAPIARVTGGEAEGRHRGGEGQDPRQLDPWWLDGSEAALVAAADVRDEGVALVFEGESAGSHGLDGPRLAQRGRRRTNGFGSGFGVHVAETGGNLRGPRRVASLGRRRSGVAAREPASSRRGHLSVDCSDDGASGRYESPEVLRTKRTSAGGRGGT